MIRTKWPSCNICKQRYKAYLICFSKPRGLGAIEVLLRSHSKLRFTSSCQSLTPTNKAKTAMLDDFELWDDKSSASLALHLRRQNGLKTRLYTKNLQARTYSFQERFFCGLNLFFLKVRPQAMHPRPRMISTVLMSLGVLNIYGSSAMAHKPTPISIKRCPTLSPILSK